MHVYQFFYMALMAMSLLPGVTAKHKKEKKPPKYKPMIPDFETKFTVNIHQVRYDIHGNMFNNTEGHGSPPIDPKDYAWDTRLVCVSDTCGSRTVSIKHVNVTAPNQTVTKRDAPLTDHNNGTTLVENLTAEQAAAANVNNRPSNVTVSECLEKTFRCVDRRVFAIALGEMREEAECQTRKCFERKRSSMAQLIQLLGWFDL